MFHHRQHLPSYGPQQYRVPSTHNPGVKHQKSSSETRKAIDHYSYALNEEIGRGFSSRVYKGRDENTQENVAVKVIDMKMVKQSIHATLLKNEINALKQFNSQSIMKLYDVFQTQNNTYIITEFCDGGDLSGLIKRRGKVDEPEAQRLLQQIVLALYEINKKGFIHRDIKPANVLLDRNIPKIADFGFAVPQQEARSQGRNFNVGTPLYMSPQALRQQGHTEKGDVWAIGILYYELLFGRTPYNAQSETALISNILHQPLHIPSSPAISDDSKDFIRKCLQVDEARRMRVKDMAHHSLITARTSHTPAERIVTRPPLQEIVNDMPAQIQKFKRSQSQGVKEYKTQQDQPKKKDPIQQKNAQIIVQRSSSQQNALNPKQPVKTTAFEEPEKISNKSKTISPEFKANNEILFSQINFCRFLYKFSQNLAGSKVMMSEFRDKLLFIMGKNIAMKITRLMSVTEKENRVSNSFQLDDIENYKRSESHVKFSQAITEYNDKYLKHFEKILKLAQKNDFNKDPIIGSLSNSDLVETPEFYRITQAYLRVCLQEIKSNLKSINMQKLSLDALLPDDLQTAGFICQGLSAYAQLAQKCIDFQNDYRSFQKHSQAELLVERKPGNMTFGQLEQLIIQLN